MIEILAQVTGKDHAGREFTAGIVLWDDVVIETAPKLFHLKRKTRAQVRDYCYLRNWTVEMVHELTRATRASPAPAPSYRSRSGGRG